MKILRVGDIALESSYCQWMLNISKDFNEIQDIFMGLKCFSIGNLIIERRKAEIT